MCILHEFQYKDIDTETISRFFLSEETRHLLSKAFFNVKICCNLFYTTYPLFYHHFGYLYLVSFTTVWFEMLSLEIHIFPVYK